MDTEAFRDFERAAHDRVAGGYHDFFEPVTGGAIPTLLDAAAVRAGSRVLDVATGPGAVAAAAAARGASTVVGVDLSPRMVALAASLHPEVEFREADAEARPFDAGAFDSVVGNFGVGHFPRPKRAVAEVTRVLARGGRAALSWWQLPARNRVNGVFFDALSRAEAPPPPGLSAGPAVFRFSGEAELLALLTAAGLEDVAAREVTWVHAVPSAEAWWQGGLGSLARASASILGQAPAMQRRIRAPLTCSWRRTPSRAAFACPARPGSARGERRDVPSGTASPDASIGSLLAVRTVLGFRSAWGRFGPRRPRGRSSMRHLALVIASAAVMAYPPPALATQESFPIIVNYAVHHDAAAPRGSDILGPDSEESRHERERPLHYPHPEHVDRPVLDAPTASLSSLPLSGTPNQWDGVRVGEAGGGSWIPPDSTGAVGSSEYVQWVNAAFAIFDKVDGSRKSDPGNSSITSWKANLIWKGFGGGCERNNDGDPIVQYDRFAHRWVMTQFSVSTKPYLQCVAVSSSDSFYDSFFHQNGATFYRYSFSYSNFNDYPKLGVWPDAYYITFNMFKGNFVGPWACAYDRAKMLVGAPATQVCFKISSAYASLLPADLDGNNAPPAGTPNYLLSLGSGNCATVGGVAKGCLNFWKFHVDFTTPANSTLTRTTFYVNAFNRACNGGACIPQPGTTQTLDSLGDRLMWRFAYRRFSDGHESLVANHSVTVGSVTGIRWYEIREPAAISPNLPVVYQQGSFAPDSLHRWMGSIAMDKIGNIAVGYSVSSTTAYPGIRITGRAASDPLGTLSASETTIITGTGAQTRTRWGDYSHMSVDPVDDCTFYYTNQYLPSNGAWNWITRISRLKFASCQ